ncbi:MAG: Nif3-like dinuclear metal center hexameric protein [Chitinophagaceae bacterium]
MKISEVIALFGQHAPFLYQESYDNSGLQVGDPDATVTGALLTLDVTEEVLDEAIAQNCNLIIAHHPLIFSGLKQLTSKNYVQRIAARAVKADLNILAIHTNLDNMHNGVNAVIAHRLGLQQCRILQPRKGGLLKLSVLVPDTHLEPVREALFAAGAGAIGDYKECSFQTKGEGTFRPGPAAQPFIGTSGGERESVQEMKIEVIVPLHLQSYVAAALHTAHPYEEPAFDWLVPDQPNALIGAGMIGELEAPLKEQDFLKLLKINMKAEVVRHTAFCDRMVKRVAVCGGSGSFLLNDAIRSGADVFVSADFKYHQFFDAEGRIVIADIGHYETEQFTPKYLVTYLRKKMLPSPFFYPQWIPIR